MSHRWHWVWAAKIGIHVSIALLMGFALDAMFRFTSRLLQDILPLCNMFVLWKDVDPARVCLAHEDKFYVWEEFRTCIEACGNGFEFQDYLQKTHEEGDLAFPWTIKPDGCAVLVEFRPLEKLLRLSVQNIMDNLPVSWCVQIAGSTPVLDAIRKLFPIELIVEKIRLLDLQKEDVSQETVSAIFADRAFIDQLPGEDWLMFQVDSVICAQQRRLLKHFIQKDYGWWGAPWRHETGEPYFGGNGGISLRQKRFTMEILDRHTMDPVTNEDGWFYHHALEMLGDGLTRPPAPFYEAMQFSVETIMHTRPFAVHQMWNHLTPDHDMADLMTNCPEILSVMPAFFLEHWSSSVCAAAIDRSRFPPYERIDFNWTACTTGTLQETGAPARTIL